ncbi:DUF2924 domain-containing protein [Qipengyuania aurantiaca]|uniref:DUF2924 domain-containing protein n=1 Tax=Qipengyuania aurantiaca TaxID=2867233 RepID=A0ABX8ZPM5_9SPHN|nr:DUF2924 domain-containing protein [Qipengyuania aurantiaca]QZD90971.1 DUF2924 domain-containing protein [Qipengyuania aurantiaca]
MGSVKQLQLADLPGLPAGQLKGEWARRMGAPAPNLSPDLLRLGLGYELQKQRLGGLSRESQRLLRQNANASSRKPEATTFVPRNLTPGTQLVRDWHGEGHTVTVLGNGFEHSGKTYRSLSAVAKAITGSHLNGPRFFGLT